MPPEPVLYLFESDVALCQRFQGVGRAFGCCVYAAGETAGGFELLRRFSPDVIVIGAGLPLAESIVLCQQIRGDTDLKACSLLLLGNADVPDGLIGLVDDLLRRDAPDYEFVIRLQNGIRQSQFRRQAMVIRQELERLCGEQERSGDYVNETTMQLVEIAAELQSEVVHSVQREEESVRAAQLDTIAQAAAALRHEINNPLFAILGSAESALKRLDAMNAASGTDLTPIRTSLERILRGADRIEQVIQAISEMLTPVTTDYIPGVSMLNLSKLDLSKNAAPILPPS